MWISKNVEDVKLFSNLKGRVDVMIEVFDITKLFGESLLENKGIRDLRRKIENKESLII